MFISYLLQLPIYFLSLLALFPYSLSLYSAFSPASNFSCSFSPSLSSPLLLRLYFVDRSNNDLFPFLMFLLFAMIVQDPHAQVEGSMKAQLVREIRRFPLLIVESRTGRKYLSSITEIANAVPRFSLFRGKTF